MYGKPALRFIDQAQTNTDPQMHVHHPSQTRGRCILTDTTTQVDGCMCELLFFYTGAFGFGDLWRAAPPECSSCFQLFTTAISIPSRNLTV